MAITNFIPTIWSENLYKALDKHYVAVANCNRDYEGDIKNMGSVVKICGVGSIDVNDYTRNTDMSTPQTLSDTVKELVIDQAKYFNFQIDDVDRAQSTPKLMEAAMSVAADALADAADKFIYGLWESIPNILTVSDVSADNIQDTLIKARELLYQKNVTNSSDIVFEVSPAIASLIIKSKMLISTDNTPILENGCIGSFCGCKIYVSNNICAETANDESTYRCLVRTKRAIAFAEQLSEIDAYRPEKRFADAVKGLHLYGASVVYPDEALVLELTVGA